MQVISRFSEIAPRYDALLCDVWGVIRDGRDILPDAIEALVRFREQGGTVCLVSNAPRPSSETVPQLQRMGLPDEAWDAAVTSGDVTRAELAARAPGPVYRIGPAYDDALFAGLGLEFSSLEEAAFIACSAPDDDRNETPDDYRDRLAGAAARGLEMVVANPDIVVQYEDRLVYCAGALGRLYRELGGTSIIAGKPYRPIYRRAMELLGREEGDLDRVLAVGDGPETDLAGAARIGCDALFIGGGILGAALGGAGFTEATVSQALKEYGAGPEWAAPQLVW